MDGRRGRFKMKRASREFSLVRIPLAEYAAQILRKTKNFEDMASGALGFVVGRSKQSFDNLAAIVSDQKITDNRSTRSVGRRGLVAHDKVAL